MGKQVTISGKRWQLVERSQLANRGDVDSPDTPGKQIRISRDLEGEERLEVIVHEITHCAFWQIDELAVEEFGRDLARILYRKLGYRRPEDLEREG